MKILCISSRNWAIKIFKVIKIKRKNDKIKIIKSNDIPNLKTIMKFNPKIILWYGFNKKIPFEIYNNFFSIMLHPSKLPLFRGGSPIQNQIIRNITNSAVTLFKINKIIDGGPIIAQKKLSLNGSLKKIFSEITKIGIELTIQILKKKKIRLRKQLLKNGSFFKRRKPVDSEITLYELKNKDSKYLFNKIRMLDIYYPRPFIRTKDNKKLIIKKSEIT